MRTNTHITIIRHQAGVTLIEVLVTMFILAIGLLGLAGLQANSLKNNQAALYRSQATVLAYDIADRMRANRTAALSGSYNVAIGSSGSSGGIVLADITEWKDALERELPRGDGSVTVDLNGNANIVIKWIENNDAAADVGPYNCGYSGTGKQVLCTVTGL